MGTPSPLVVVAGTGTEVGKTHVAVALLRAWGSRARVVGYKPVETGVTRVSSQVSPEIAGADPEGEDAGQLRRASTFHVKHALFAQTFRDPVSPHLAARREGSTVDLVRLAEQASQLRQEAEGVVVELAGGLFTPLDSRLYNADFARKLAATHLLLVAPDRLGVLHDIAATLHAATHVGLRIHGVVLSESATKDASSGTNAGEIEAALGARVLAAFPRADQEDEGTKGAAGRLLEALSLSHDRIA
jgi:dethiobiotin synthetase